MEVPWDQTLSPTALFGSLLPFIPGWTGGEMCQVSIQPTCHMIQNVHTVMCALMY